MPMVQKWRLPTSNREGKYREFDSRTEYLEYLRGRRALRMADARFAMAREKAFERVHDAIHAVSSWDDVAKVLMGRTKEFRILLDDPEFEMVSCLFNPNTTKSHTDTEWHFTLIINANVAHPLQRKIRDRDLRLKRDWLDMPDRFSSFPFDDAPTLSKLLVQLQLMQGLNFMYQNGHFDSRVTILKKAFPEIAIMDKMKAPPRKMFA